MLQVVFLRFEKLRGVVVSRNRSDFVAHAVVFATALAGVVFTDDFIHDVHAIRHLAEYRVAVVQKRRGSGGDEKLRTVRARACIGHRKNARSRVAQFWVKLISEFVSRTATTGFCGIAPLEHEAFDHAMKCHVVIIAAAGKVEKIRAGEGSFGREKSRIDVAGGGVKCDFDV